MTVVTFGPHSFDTDKLKGRGFLTPYQINGVTYEYETAMRVAAALDIAARATQASEAASGSAADRQATAASASAAAGSATVAGTKAGEAVASAAQAAAWAAGVHMPAVTAGDAGKTISIAVGGTGYTVSNAVRLVNTPSGVNCIVLASAGAGDAPYIQADGPDTNVGFNLKSKGIGAALFRAGDHGLGFMVSHVANSVNYIRAIAASAGNSPGLSAEGADTNVAFLHKAKGSASHVFYCNEIAQLRVDYAAGATNYLIVAGSNGGDPVLTSSGGGVKLGRAARGTLITLTDAATVAPNFDLGNYFIWTLGGNRVLANPTGLVPGQSGSITLVQDNAGNRTLSFGSYWKPVGRTVPTLSTAAGYKDKIVYEVVSATEIHYGFAKDFG